VNVIDLWPTNAGRAIVTAYRYMLNDFAPYVYATNDFGATWKRIADGTNGIPVGHFARVVREDPDRPGLLYAGTEYGMYISFDAGAHWQRFQNNLPVTPIMDLKVYRHDLIVATEGRAFWLLEGLPVLQQLKAGLETDAGALFKPVDGYRQGGPLPTFYYWLRDQPAAPITLEVMDSTGAVVYTGTGQPGAGVITPPSPVPPPAGAGGRGGRGFGGAEAFVTEAGAETAPGEAGRGRGAEGEAGRGRGAEGEAGRGRGAEGEAGRGAEGRGGRGGGRGGFGGAAIVSAHLGLNRTTWNARLAPLFTVPQRIVMWGGAGGGQGPKAAPGTYTVKLTSGAWSQTQTFRLKTDPRLPTMTDTDGAEQLKLARDVGQQIKQLYDTLLQIRDVKKQAAEISQQADARTRMQAAAKALTDKLVAIEGDITQLHGEAGQDALNFPGRIDNQWVALYGNIASAERKPNKAVTERYADLKPPTDQLMQRAAASLKNDVAAFNAAAAKAGVKQGIVVK
jgi:hypothetical protein